MSRHKMKRVPKKMARILGFDIIYKIDKELALGNNDYADREDLERAIEWLYRQVGKSGGPNV